MEAANTYLREIYLPRHNRELTVPAADLEQAIAYVEDDELVEVTPSAIRLRKRHRDPHARKRADRKADSEAA